MARRFNTTGPCFPAEHYMDTLGCREGWLILFATRQRMSWKERLTWKTLRRQGRRRHVVGA